MMKKYMENTHDDKKYTYIIKMMIEIYIDNKHDDDDDEIYKHDKHDDDDDRKIYIQNEDDTDEIYMINIMMMAYT